MKGASNFDKLCHQVFDGKNDGTNYLARETDIKYSSAIDGKYHEHYYSAMVILKDEEGKNDG